MYGTTVARDTLMPNLAISPWKRGVPHSALSRLMCPMSARVSDAMARRLGHFHPHGHRQWCRTPCRRLRRTVSAGMMARACGHRDQRGDDTIHKHRSRGEQWGRFTDRSKTPS